MFYLLEDYMGQRAQHSDCLWSLSCLILTSPLVKVQLLWNIRDSVSFSISPENWWPLLVLFFPLVFRTSKVNIGDPHLLQAACLSRMLKWQRVILCTLIKKIKNKKEYLAESHVALHYLKNLIKLAYS